MSVQLMPHFADVQAHYDLSDEFFRLFLDSTLNPTSGVRRHFSG